MQHRKIGVEARNEAILNDPHELIDMGLEEISMELYRVLQGMIEKRTDKNPRINEEIDPRIKQRSIQIIPNYQITITKERYRKQQTKRKIYIVFFISEKNVGR